MNQSISECFEFKTLIKLIENQISELESANNKKKDEFERKRRLDEIRKHQEINKANQTKRFHAQK